MRLVSIYDQEMLKKNGLFVKPDTLRKWKHLGRYVKDGLFIKIGNRLYVDLEAWERILRREQEELIKQAERLERAKVEAGLCRR